MIKLLRIVSYYHTHTHTKKTQTVPLLLRTTFHVQLFPPTLSASFLVIDSIAKTSTRIYTIYQNLDLIMAIHWIWPVILFTQTNTQSTQTEWWPHHTYWCGTCLYLAYSIFIFHRRFSYQQQNTTEWCRRRNASTSRCLTYQKKMMLSRLLLFVSKIIFIWNVWNVLAV